MPEFHIPGSLVEQIVVEIICILAVPLLETVSILGQGLENNMFNSNIYSVFNTVWNMALIAFAIYNILIVTIITQTGTNNIITGYPGCGPSYNSSLLIGD